MPEYGREPKLEEPLASLLHRAERWFIDQLTIRMNATGAESVTVAHTMVLAHLGEGSISTADLARRAGVTRQTMHHAVGLLRAQGLVHLEPSGGFPRTGLVRVTQLGAERRKTAQLILAELEAELGDHLGRDVTARLRDALQTPWPSVK